VAPDQKERIRSIVKGIVVYDQEEPALERIFAEIENMEWKAYGLGHVHGTEGRKALNSE
jgi:hypothetical protein